MNSLQRDIACTSSLSAKFRLSDLENIYISVLTIAAASLAYLDIANYYHTLTQGAFLPKYAYYALAAGIAPIILLRSRGLSIYLGATYIHWVFLLVLLNLAHLIFYALVGDNEAVGLTFTRIQFLVLATLIGFLFYQAQNLLLGVALAVLALVLSTLQIVDFFSPGMLLPLDTPGVVLGRASSTLINANKAAESLVLLSVLGIAVLRPNWRIWLLLAVFPGIFLTFSRAGLLAWLIVFVAGFWFKLFARSAYIVALLVLPPAAIFSVGVLDFLFSSVDSSALDNLYNRVMFVSTLDTADDSAQERLLVAGLAFDQFLSNPLLGNGAGYTHFWNLADVAPHNQHLLILAEYGLAGYILFIWLMVIMFRGGGYFKSLQVQPLSKIFFIVFIVFTPFTHNMFDNLYWLVTFATLGLRDRFSRISNYVA